MIQSLNILWKGQAGAKGFLFGAVQVRAIRDLEYVAVPLVESDPIVHSRIWALATFKSTIDNVGHCAVARQSASCAVCCCWFPSPSHDIVGRWLRSLRCHPEPQGCLEGDRWIAGHYVRIVYAVEAYRLSGLAIVVIPDNNNNNKMMMVRILVSWE